MADNHEVFRRLLRNDLAASEFDGILERLDDPDFKAMSEEYIQTQGPNMEYVESPMFNSDCMLNRLPALINHMPKLYISSEYRDQEREAWIDTYLNIKESDNALHLLYLICTFGSRPIPIAVLQAWAASRLPSDTASIAPTYVSDAAFSIQETLAGDFNDDTKTLASSHPLENDLRLLADENIIQLQHGAQTVLARCEVRFFTRLAMVGLEDISHWNNTHIKVLDQAFRVEGVSDFSLCRQLAPLVDDVISQKHLVEKEVFGRLLAKYSTYLAIDGDHQKAEEIGKAAIAIITPEMSRETQLAGFDCKLRLSQCLLDHGRHPEVQTLIAAAINEYNGVLPRPRHVEALTTLIKSFICCGKFSDAAKLQEDLLELQRLEHGEDSVEYTNAFNNLSHYKTALKETPLESSSRNNDRKKKKSLGRLLCCF